MVIASGAAPRHPEGFDIASDVLLHRLHATDDAEALRESIPQADGRRIVVAGAGFVGTERASHYVAAGAEGILVGQSATPLAGALGAEISPRLTAMQHERTHARLGTTAHAITPSGYRARFTLSDGSSIEVDAVILAHWAVPATAWTDAPEGIRVDDRLRAPEGGWYAAGGAAYIAFGGARLTTGRWDRGCRKVRCVYPDPIRQSTEDQGSARTPLGRSSSSRHTGDVDP